MIVCALVRLAACATASAAGADASVLWVTGGAIRGAVSETSEDVRVFRAIPYAATTAEANRWKPPQPVVAWEGVRDCTKFGPACPQAPYPKESPYYREPEPQSEDCLFLNVWTAAKDSSERRPVMVWIHGGALTRGSGAVDIYEGTALALKGVVVVTINYRLGPLGFFAHPELTAESKEHAAGNYGFLDQIAALEWVRDNIAQFGGDPACVTIFGESAGALSVCVLAASPRTKDLFHRAIAQSGSAFRALPDLPASERNGARLAEAVKAKSLAELREIPPETLMEHADGRIGPNIDGFCLTQDVLTTFREGKQHRIPTIVGSNADEMTTLSPIASRPTTLRALDVQIALLLGNPAEVHRLYPAADDAEATRAYLDIVGDVTFTLPARTWARSNTKVGASTYLYQFSHVTRSASRLGLGAFHAAEIVYVFDNLHRLKRPVDESERELAMVMSTYWTTFARTGDPNASGLRDWPAYDAEHEPAMQFRSPAQLTHHIRKEKLDLLEGLLEKRRLPATK